MKRIYSIPSSVASGDQVNFKWQNKKSKYLAVAADSSVNIYNRHGKHIDQVNLFGCCISLTWNIEGDWLVIITDRSPIIFLWNSINQRIQQIDSGMKESLSVIMWSSSNPALLFAGTVKGNLLIYNNQTSRKVPITGKHTKRIVSGAWSENNLIALVGEDKVLTISNEDGDTIGVNSLRFEGSNVKFLHAYSDEKRNNSSESNAVALVLNRKMLFAARLSDTENPFVLNFQDWYEKIVDYYCYPTGNLFIVFSSGLVVTISTCLKNFGTELLQVKAHKDSVDTLSICNGTNKIVTCSENNLKIFDLQDHNDIENVLTIDDEPAISLLEWTNDGQLLAMASTSGTIHIYLSQLKILGDSYGTSLAFLSSLLEVTVFNVHEEVHDSVIIIRVEIEPSHIAIGPFHLAVAMNNKIWLYSLIGNEMMNLLTNEHEYVGIVKCIKLNATYMAVQFTNGTLHLHLIEGNDKLDYANNQNNNFIYPDGNDASARNNQVASHCLTNEFLLYALENGIILCFILEDWDSVILYRHPFGIQTIESNLNGTRLVLLDERNDAFVYNLYHGSVIQISSEHVPPKPIKILWESWLNDKCVFLLCDTKFIYVYSAPRDTIEGPKVEFVGKMKIPTGQFPLLFYNGVVVCQTKSGKTSNFVLTTHDYTIKNNASETIKKDVFNSIIKLRRYPDAIKICNFINDECLWKKLATAALFDLEIDIAISVYQQIREFGRAYSLKQIKCEEDRRLFAGYIAEFLGQIDLAQKHFLASSKPLRALEMRKNLLQWQEALALARHLAPDEIPTMSRELAQHQEYSADYRRALDNFELALTSMETSEDHARLCKKGIARNAIRCRDVKRGMSLAIELEDEDLIAECGQILENLEYLQEAATMYEHCGQFDQAASLYLKGKNVSKLDSILSNITDVQVLCKYANMKESERQFRSALEIYLKAKQWLDVVRIYLDNLNNPGEAVKIVRETHSVEGAKLIAKYFQRRDDMTTAIEFLVISKCYEDAYSLAQTTAQMDTYADIMLDYVEEDNLANLRTIAIYYEQVDNRLKAGKFYCTAKSYRKGVKLLLEAASTSVELESESLNLAIEAAAKANDEQITRLILDFLMGDGDGVPKDFKYLFKLYMKLKHYKEAAKTALIIGREEQNLGNYRNSHQLLFAMCTELRRNGISIPSEMVASLLLVHSYMLAKLWIRVGNHKLSAKLLMRVADNLTKFPSHSVQILTTLVIECLRAGLSKNALRFAQILMKPDNREKIDAKFKKKIEVLVRKSPGVQYSGEELEQELDVEYYPCPYCEEKVKEDEFTCYSCRNTIPFCIASGMHIDIHQLSKCPQCSFPAISGHFHQLLSFDSTCPMCGSEVHDSSVKTVHQLQDIFDVISENGGSSSSSMSSTSQWQ